MSQVQNGFNNISVFKYESQSKLYTFLNYINKNPMARSQLQDVGKEKQKNKSHKTIRQKLKKRRANEKQHLKNKKQQRKKFNSEDQKRAFFLKHFNTSTDQKYKEAKKQFKYKKIKKYIEKFINIYQDDLEDFFGLFKEFDQAGFIDISGLENKKLQKVLVKLFRYLPLNEVRKESEAGVEAVEYRKKEESTLNLENVIRNLIAQAIENYLQNGTQDQKDQKSQDDVDSSQNQNITDIKKGKKNKSVTVNVRTEGQGIFTLPKQKIEAAYHSNSFGPCISAEQREKIEQIFEKQLKDMENQKQAEISLEDDKFQRIFSMGQSVSKLKKPIQRAPLKSTLEDFPDELLAEGSAKIGQKVTINQDDEKQYNAINRPKKLIDEHREIMAINRGEDPQGKSSHRRPFDRQRDVVNSRSKTSGGNLGSGVFFDFKDKMTAPKKTNNFL